MPGTPVDVGGLEVVQHPPALWNFLMSSGAIVHVLSSKILDPQHTAVLVQGKFGYAQGTIQCDSPVGDNDIVQLEQLQGDEKIPLGKVL